MRLLSYLLILIFVFLWLSFWHISEKNSSYTEIVQQNTENNEEQNDNWEENENEEEENGEDEIEEWEEDDDEEEEENDVECIEDKYELEGVFNTTKWTTTNYEVKVREWISIFEPEIVNFTLYDEEQEEIASQETEIFSHNFEDTGSYLISAYIEDEDWCEYILEEEINIYNKVYLYIWDDLEEEWYFNRENLENNNIFLKEISIDQQTFLVEEDFFNLLSEEINHFVNAEKIIINNRNFSSILEFIGRLWNFYELNLEEKDFYLISWISTNFLERTLAQYLERIWITQIYVIQNKDLLRFINDISIEEEFDKRKEYIDTFSLEFESLQNQYFLSYITNVLIYYGMPINLLWIMLTISIAALITSIFRQIIWFSVFWVFYPIMFAVSVLILGLTLTFAFLFIAFISTLLVKLFIKKIHLLSSARVSLLIIVYFIITFLVFWADKAIWTEFIDYTVFSNSFIIFPIIFIIIITDKILSDNFSIFSLWWIVSLIEFLFVSFVIYLVINYPTFQFFMLSYPDVLFLVLIANILVGRFTWLQLLEYLRFMPLMKNKDSEE